VHRITVVIVLQFSLGSLQGCYDTKNSQQHLAVLCLLFSSFVATAIIEVLLIVSGQQGTCESYLLLVMRFFAYHEIFDPTLYSVLHLTQVTWLSLRYCRHPPGGNKTQSGACSAEHSIGSLDVPAIHCRCEALPSPDNSPLLLRERSIALGGCLKALHQDCKTP